MNKKLNLLHLISSLDVGGAEKMLIDFLNESKLHNDDTNFVIVVMNNKYNKFFKKELENTGYKTYFLERNESSKNPETLFELLRIITSNKISIVHSHTYGSKTWSILCKIFNPKLKLFFTIHSMFAFEGLNKLKLFLHKNFIDMNIAISDAVLKNAKSFGIKKVKRIYNGILLNKYMGLNKEKSKKIKIINVARINHEVKGQDILIKALKLCKDEGLDFECNFAGGVYDYDKESFEYLQDLTKKLELQEDINFLGNRNDIPELLSESDLFILPSRYEGLGLVILEAMISKVPVICSNIDGPAELIEDEKTGILFKNEDYKDLAEKIILLYNNKQLQNSLINNAFEYSKFFDISIMYNQYLEVYRGEIQND